jgi:hypothetical protein
VDGQKIRPKALNVRMKNDMEPMNKGGHALFFIPLCVYLQPQVCFINEPKENTQIL